MMAGDPERASRATRSRDGIPVDDGTWQALTILAADLAIAPPDARGA
jgi:LDH2 family malate/lactate/ureidoglycolate dehydrogenase